MYFNLADKVFDNKKDVILIANSLLKAVTERVIKPAEDYNFQIYLLVTGKKANVLPIESKVVITGLLDHLNNMDLSTMQYSVLSRIKKRYIKMQENLSKLLISSQFSPDLSNDTKNIKFLIENILKVMKKNQPLKDLPISTLVIAKRVGDAVITENDIIINTTYEELKVLIDKSPKTVKTTPIKVIENSNEDQPVNKPVKKSSRTKTPRSSKSTQPITST